MSLDKTAAPKAKENSLIICFFVGCFMQDMDIGEQYFRHRPVHLLNCVGSVLFCLRNNGVRANMLSLLQSLVEKAYAFNGLLMSVAQLFIR